jgi:hypothetical protein
VGRASRPSISWLDGPARTVVDLDAVELASPHRTYALRDQGIGAAVFNLVINGVLAYLMFRSLAAVPLWGAQSIAGDTIGTGFFLPFMTCLIVTPLTWRQVRRGALPAPAWTRIDHPMLARLPQRPATRGALLGLLGAALAAPPALFGLAVMGVAELDFWSFVAFKSVFAAILAAIVSPVIALAALGDTSAPRV